MDISRNCAICFNNIEIDKLVNTTCNHQYCNTCFFKWIYANKTCPLCRHVIINDPTSEVTQKLEELRQLYEWEYEHLETLENTILQKEDTILLQSNTIERLENQKKNIMKYIQTSNRTILLREYNQNRRRNRGSLFFT